MKHSMKKLLIFAVTTFAAFSCRRAAVEPLGTEANGQHTALAETLRNEQLIAADSPTPASILEITANRILPLCADSVVRQPFVTVTATDTVEGYHSFSPDKGTMTITVSGVCAFSLQVEQVGAQPATVAIAYRSGDRSDDIDEDIETPQSPYDIPAVITDPNAVTTITIRSRQGLFRVRSLHMLHTYSKREMQMRK